MQGSVVSVRSAGKNGTLVKIELLIGGEKRIYTVSEGTYREIGCPLSDEILDGDMLSHIVKEHGRREAMKKALNILSYADNNSKNLYRKLIMAGFSKDDATYAVTECIKLGYIDEERQLQRLVYIMWERDLLGPAKIFAKLAAKGYRQSEISRTIDALRQNGEIDFAKSQKELLMKKAPATYEEKQKILFRYGYKNETD